MNFDDNYFLPSRKMRFVLLLLLLTAVFINISAALRNFLRGRSKDGNLGILLSSKEHKWLPKEQWFIQMLDHFNPIDARVWKQV